MTKLNESSELRTRVAMRALTALLANPSITIYNIMSECTVTEAFKYADEFIKQMGENE